MLLHLDSDAITIATQLVARFKDPQVRAESITPTLSPSTDDSWPVVLAADISTKIDISRTSLNGGSDLALTGFVEGISWDITQAERGGTTWTCDLDISTL